jgi:hypothetical protein
LIAEEMCQDCVDIFNGGISCEICEIFLRRTRSARVQSSSISVAFTRPTRSRTHLYHTRAHLALQLTLFSEIFQRKVSTLPHSPHPQDLIQPRLIMYDHARRSTVTRVHDFQGCIQVTDWVEDANEGGGVTNSRNEFRKTTKLRRETNWQW